MSLADGTGPMGRLWSHGVAACLALVWLGCAPSAPAAAAPSAQADGAPSAVGPAPVYEFPALDGATISSDSSLGRNTVIAFITTYGGSSQAQARFLRGVAHDHVPRTNCYAVFTERPDNRPLVEMFVHVLDLRIPCAHIEFEWLKGGPFADVVAVPTVVVLDRSGRIAWRKDALATQDEIERALRRVE